MYQIAQNNFNEGVSKDVSALVQKPTTALHLKNVQLFTRENQSWVITNIRGTKREFTLPSNHVVLASKTYANVCYLILAEVIDGLPTGKGQLGSYPSPAYGGNPSGEMVSRYNALHNYSGDANQYPGKNGAFVSGLFNFPLDKNMDLVIQPSYDGSVNLVITDGLNPMRILNTAFSSVNGETYSIITRDAGNEDNRYTPLDFESRINLNLYTKTVAKVNFSGVFSGGQVKGGNYRYFFRYTTNDGNETAFFAQSGLVQVAHGYSPSSIRGAKGDGEDTDKQVRFLLTRLDENYSFVSVYFVYASGENSTVENVYKLGNRIPIRKGEVHFTHSGFEDLDRQDPSVLQDVYGSVDTADCLAEVQGYLIAGGIKQKPQNISAFRNLARGMTLSHQVREMEGGLGSPEMNLNRNVSDSQVKDFYNMGYYNPHNSYHGVGYWGGEAVPFGIRLILNNGELTDVFPVIGCDNLNNTFTENSYSGQDLAGIDSHHNGFNTIGGFNTLGIYRFPRRQYSGIYNGLTDTVNVYGIRFQIPIVSDEIKRISKGIVFVRANRKANVLQQGIMVDTFKVPIDDRYDFDDKDGGARRLSAYQEYDSLYKVIPAPGFRLEASYVIDKDHFSAGNGGIHYAHFADNYAGKYRQGGGYQDSFAFLSGELFSDPEKSISQFSSRNVLLLPIEAISFLHSVRTARGDSYSNGDLAVNQDHFNVLVQNSSRSIASMGSFRAKTTYVIGGMNSPMGEDMFSSGAFFMDQSFNDRVAVFPLSFNDYIGIKLTGLERFNVSAPSGRSERLAFEFNKFGKIEEMAYLVNVYGEGGLWNTDTLKQNYLSLAGLEYFEISERMSWDDLESSMDANRGITLFGGDCFVVPTYRRMYRNRFGKNEAVFEKEARDSIKDANVGMTLAWMSESNYNTALRVPANEDLNSSEQNSFAPFGKNLTISTEALGNNSWRVQRVAETKSFNHGYRKLDGENFGIVTDFDRPFVVNDWYSRLMNSGKHIPNAFVNGYRQWGFDLQDYDASKGRITKLVQFGNDLLMIQEDGISVIPINQRMESANDSAGPVFVESNEVLSPYQGYKSHNMGCQHPDSVVQTESAIYAYDAKRFTWWMLSLGGELKSISDLKIASDLNKHASGFSKKKFNKHSVNIVGGYDPENKEVYLSFFDLSGNSFAIGYSELTQTHTGEKDYVAKKFLTLNNRIISIPAAQPRLAYSHNSEDEKRLLIYGSPKKALIRFVVNKQQEVNKVFDFMEIVSNHVFPSKVTFWIQGANSNSVPVYDPVDITRSNSKYREEKAVVTIPRTGWQTDRSITEYLGMTEDNAVSQVFEGARVRGKAMVVELEYESDKLVEISSVLTYYRNSQR